MLPAPIIQSFILFLRYCFNSATLSAVPKANQIVATEMTVNRGLFIDRSANQIVDVKRTQLASFSMAISSASDNCEVQVSMAIEAVRILMP